MHLHHIINHIGDKAFRGPSRVLQGGDYYYYYYYWYYYYYYYW